MFKTSVMALETRALAAASERLAAATGYNTGSESLVGIVAGSVRFKGKVMFNTGSKMAGCGSCVGPGWTVKIDQYSMSTWRLQMSISP